jgi:hypothetical protein
VEEEMVEITLALHKQMEQLILAVVVAVELQLQ